MARKLNTTVHVAGEKYLPGQVVDGEVEAFLSETWPADRDDLWEAVAEPKAAKREEKSSRSEAQEAEEQPKAAGRK
jgi:hypothetical protein